MLQLWKTNNVIVTDKSQQWNEREIFKDVDKGWLIYMLPDYANIIRVVIKFDESFSRAPRCNKKVVVEFITHEWDTRWTHYGFPPVPYVFDDLSYTLT